MKAHEKRINLLPKEYIQEEKFRLYRTIGSAIIGVEVLAFILLMVLPPKREMKRLDNQVIALEAEVASDKYKNVNETLEELDKTQKELQAWMVQYKDLKKESYVTSSMMDAIISRLPSNVLIDTMEITPCIVDGANVTPGTLKITGTADTLTDVGEYSTILENMYGHDSVTMTSQYKEEIDAQSYEIIVDLPLSDEIKQQVAEAQAKQQAAAEAAAAEGSESE